MAAVHGLRVHDFNETLGKAFADKADAVAGLQAWQDACAKYAKDQGFTVPNPRWRLAGSGPGAEHHCPEGDSMSTAVGCRTQHSPPDTAPLPRLTAAKRRQYGAAYVLVVPFFLVFVAMFIVPLVYAGYLPLQEPAHRRRQLRRPRRTTSAPCTDPCFLSGVARVASSWSSRCRSCSPLRLFFALALDSGMMRLAKFIRLGSSCRTPSRASSPPSCGATCTAPTSGRSPRSAEALGLRPPPFLTQTGMLFSIMNIVTWAFIGYNMIIIYAALRSIPSELYEAAASTAPEPRIAWSIKIPAVRPALLLTVIFSVIGTFQLFTEPKLMFTLAPNVIGTA